MGINIDQVEICIPKFHLWRFEAKILIYGKK